MSWANGPKDVVAAPRLSTPPTRRQLPDPAKRRATVMAEATGQTANFRSRGLLVIYFLTTLKNDSPIEAGARTVLSCRTAAI